MLNNDTQQTCIYTKPSTEPKKENHNNTTKEIKL